MKRSSLKIIGITIATAIFISGCGTEFPELTDEQYEQVVEYSAGLLLKHAQGSEERLQNVAAIQASMDYAEKQAEREERKNNRANGASSASTNEDTIGIDTEQTTGTDQASGMGASNDAGLLTSENADTENNNEVTSGEMDQEITGSGEETGAEEATEEISLADASNQLSDVFHGLTVSYDGYSVRKDYPNANSQGAVSASSGSRILVLNFTLRNDTSSDISITMPSQRNAIKILLNGKAVSYPMMTMLDDDLSTFTGTIAAGKTREMVYLADISEERLRSVESIGLRYENGDNSIDISLE